MPDVIITVREKIAQVSGSPEIVCGNSDYAAVFDLDSEWDSYDVKTMRVAWLDVRTGKLRYDDVPFSGSTCVLPAIYDAYEIAIGIYAGDIRTTTPARIPCARCITDGGSAHEASPPDVYEQIIELLEQIAKPVGFGATGDATTIIDGVNAAVVGELQPLWTQDLSSQTWVQGTGDPATGEFPPDNTTANRIRCLQYFSIPDECSGIQAKPQITSGTACLFVAYFYTDNTFISSTSWTNQIEPIPDGATRYRILISKADGSAITPDEFASCIVDFLEKSKTLPDSSIKMI